jgi:hypothetical protein
VELQNKRLSQLLKEAKHCRQNLDEPVLEEISLSTERGAEDIIQPNRLKHTL